MKKDSFATNQINIFEGILYKIYNFKLYTFGKKTII